MSNTTINIRLDSEVKKAAQDLFSELGMDMTTAVNIFLRQSIREQCIPFEIKLDKPNHLTTATLYDAENKKNVCGPFDSVEDLMEDLNA